MSTFQEILRSITSAFRWWVVVTPWEQVVRVRWGKHVQVLDKGVHVRIPLVDVVYKQSVRRRYSRLSTQTLTTRDERTVYLCAVLGYAILDIGKLYDTLHHGEEAVQAETEAYLASYIHNHDLSECAPRDIERDVVARLDLSRYGLGDVEVRITNFAVVRTYRFITGSPRDYMLGGNDGMLNTLAEDGKGK